MIAVSSWGATAQERAMPMACDRLLVGTRVHRAITIDAPAAVVFRWLCKLAPYSYDLVDNFGRRSPRELVPGVERLAVGQRFMTIFSLASFACDEHVTLRSHRVAVTYAVLSGEVSTRLVARVIFDPPGNRLGKALIGHALALGDLAMMRKQLLTLKALAERDAESTIQSATLLEH
jgi:hypothetical protein